MSEKSERTAIVISILALAISLAAVVFQYKEREDRIADRVEMLDYEIGTTRVNGKQYDDYFKIYNRSRNEVRIESVVLKANMGDGSFIEAVLLEPNKTTPLAAGDFKEFRFRFSNTTPKDTLAEKSSEFESFTGSSTVEVLTTRQTQLTFESNYHPYFLGRIQRACKRAACGTDKVIIVE